VTSDVFVDTSALYAVLDADDRNHRHAVEALGAALEQVDAGRLEVVTHGSVVVEASALVQRRLGTEASAVLLSSLVPSLRVVWVDAALHDQAAAALLAARHRSVSLVDWTSFIVMRREAIREALAYDDDFWDQGFRPFTGSP
jgi:predicted nucleic acid-binding protein